MKAMLQDEAEMIHFINLVKAEGVTKYLEIGCKYGGSLWRIGSSMPPGSRIVAVDLPHGAKESQPHLEACVEELRRTNIQVHLFLGDSTDDKIVSAVRALGPYDLCFIDANHTEPYVRTDWANYGPMARIVAFHDIGWVPRPVNYTPIEVPKVWQELKQNFKHVEFRNCPQDNGIGVLWH